jgi:RNA polymerase sigma-70 factor (ECF subfamily)
MTNSNLSLLMSRIALGDRAALKALYDAVAGKLLAVALRVMGNREMAEDVLQEVFITVWNQAARHNAAEHVQPLAWLCVMTRNRAIDMLRKTRPEVSLHWRDADGEEHFHDAPDEGETPLESLLSCESGTHLHTCLNALEGEHKQALLLAYFEGLTHSELSTRLQRPLGTIKAWVRRSLQRLKTCLEGVA